MLKKLFLLFLIAALVIMPACTKENDGNKPQDTTTDSKQETPPPEVLTIRVATYNVKHFELTNHSFTEFAQEIQDAGIEIIGLQEVDNGTSRSNGLNEAKELADQMGWYYKFAPAVAIKGGDFGHAILSKYPIESFNVIPLRFQTGYESRSMGHAVIDVNGYKLNFLNTHLCHESEDNIKMQLEDIAAYVKNLDNFMITGDFNTNNYPLFSVIENCGMINGSPIEYPTFPKKETGIDNIIFSLGYTHNKPRMATAGNSDHRMFYVDMSVELE